MSAKIIAAILLITLIGSSVGIMISLQRSIDIPLSTPEKFQQIFTDSPVTPAPSSTTPTATPSAPPDIDTSLTPTPLPTHPPSPTNNNSVRSRSCYKVTINGQVYEECTENGDLNFHYQD